MSEPEAERVQFTTAEREELLRIATQVASNTGWTLDEAMNALITASKVGLRAAELRAENKRLRAVVEAARTMNRSVHGTREAMLAEEALYVALDALDRPMTTQHVVTEARDV